MKKTIFFAMLTLLLLVVAACDYSYEDNITTDINVTDMDDYTPLDTLNQTNETQEEEIDESKASFTIEATEGDLVKIPIKAVDPDGDFLEYEFEDPFNDKGLWQSEIGDEGKYLTKVTVSDGRLSTSEFVLVELLRANRPPVIECPKKVTVQETETVSLNCNVFDTDGDVVLVGYEGWMRTSTKTTDYGDEGEYTVIVRAKDKEHESFAEVTVVVEDKNRAPVIHEIEDQEVMELNEFKLNVNVSDSDGDAVELSYSEPLDANGTWTPAYGDRGTYEVTVQATDGEDTVEETFRLDVLKVNRAPVIKEMDRIVVDEGQTVKLDVQAFDPDGDDLIITYEGWMDSDEYATTYDDAYPVGCSEKGCTATYEVTVTASDGTLSASETVEIRVKDQNRPPVFVYE